MYIAMQVDKDGILIKKWVIEKKNQEDLIYLNKEGF